MKKILSITCAAIIAALPLECFADETTHDAISNYLQASAPSAGQLESFSLLTDKDGRTVAEFSDPTLIHRFYSIKNDDTFTKQNVFSGYSGDFSKELDASFDEWFIPVVENGTVIGVYDISAGDPWGIKASYTPVKDGLGVGMVYSDEALDKVFPADKYGTPTELKSAFIHYPVRAIFMYAKTVDEEYIVPFTDVKIGAYDDSGKYSYSVEFNKLSVYTADTWVERMKTAKSDKERHDSERAGVDNSGAQYVDGSGNIETITPKPQNTEKPSAAPEVTAKPTERPKATEKPKTTEKPKATAKPISAPKPTEKPQVINVTPGESITVSVGDKEITFMDAQPFIDENGRTKIPIRAVAEGLGCEVDWDDATRTAVIKRGDDVVYITIGKDTLQVGNTTVQMDTAAEIKDDRTYIPVRFVGEALGMQVNWVDQ